MGHPKITPKQEEAWRANLTPEQYQVTRCSATEPAFTGEYWNHKGNGIYHCVCCSTPLFDSTTKYDSGSGWPSYFEPINGTVIKEEADTSHGMRRVEVQCNHCGAHLGHVFPDGPQPTGLRYCINSASLTFHDRDNDTNT